MEKQQNNLREEELEKMDLLAIVDDIWRGLKRFWLLCIVVVATCAIVSAFAVIVAFTPTYEAYSTFVVNSKTAYSDNAAYTNYYNETSASQLSQTFPYILTSGALSDVVAKSLDMDSVPATITADSMEGTALFTIRVRAKDAQTAYDVLQEIYDEIHRLTVSYENEEIRITMTFGLEEYDKNDGMEMAIRRADEKLYQGKETGRDKIVY